MTNSNFQIGQKAVFNYDRNYMTTERTRNHDGEVVTIIDSVWEAQGHTYITVENAHNTIYPVMIQELTLIKINN
jgi:hypothetical protein